jgi:hypothetical protein
MCMINCGPATHASAFRSLLISAFLPDLARSISVTSDILAALERNAEAADAAHEALRILLPFARP